MKGRETTLVGGDKVIFEPISRSKLGLNPSILEHDPQEYGRLTLHETALYRLCFYNSLIISGKLLNILAWSMRCPGSLPAKTLYWFLYTL